MPNKIDPAAITWDTPAPTQPQTWADVGAQAVQNIPTSAANIATGMYQAVRHPLDTAGTLLDLGAGELQKVMPDSLREMINRMDWNPEAAQRAQNTATAVNQMYVNRYGGMQNIKNTVATDPVGALMDLSAVLGGAGALAKGVGASRAGSALSTASAATDPINMAVGVAKLPLKLVPQSVADRLYQSALKMSTVLSPAERKSRTATGLADEILPTEKGLATLQGKIDEVNKSIKYGIKERARSGAVVNTQNVVNKLDDLREFYSNTLDPQPFLEDLNAMRDGFLSAHGQKIPLDKAQVIKQNTYTLLRKQYGELKSLNVEAQKALARGIKEEIVAAFPEVAKLNARDSALINLEDSISRAVNRISNRDIVGIGGPIKAGAGAAADVVTGNHAGLMAGLASWALDHPEMKARLAIAVNKGRKITPPKITARQIGMQGLYQSGNIANEVQQ